MINVHKFLIILLIACNFRSNILASLRSYFQTINHKKYLTKFFVMEKAFAITLKHSQQSMYHHYGKGCSVISSNM